jgi:hypothetical protein
VFEYRGRTAEAAFTKGWSKSSHVLIRSSRVAEEAEVEAIGPVVILLGPPERQVRQEGGGAGPATERAACRSETCDLRSSSALYVWRQYWTTWEWIGTYGCILPSSTSTSPPIAPSPNRQTLGPSGTERRKWGGRSLSRRLLALELPIRSLTDRSRTAGAVG